MNNTKNKIVIVLRYLFSQYFNRNAKNPNKKRGLSHLTTFILGIFAMLAIPNVALSSGSLNILTVGPNYGNLATANFVPTNGSTTGGVSHLGSIVTHLNEVGFNALTVSQLAAYDVVLTQWASSNLTDLGSTKVQNYVFNGGALFLDGDYANYNDLSWVGITGATNYCTNPFTFTASADPILTDSLPASPNLVNCHGHFPNFDPLVFTVFMTDYYGNNAALAGKYGSGRIILTGPDQDFHAHTGTFGTDQYQLLLNELEWTGGTPSTPLIFGNTYVVTGASAEVYGDIIADTYLTAGASNEIEGDIQVGMDVTIGEMTDIKGNVRAVGAITLGASTVVDGDVCHGAALTLGAFATYNYDGCSFAPMTYANSDVIAAKDSYSALTAIDVVDRNQLNTTIHYDLILDPSDGFTTITGVNTVVYNATSLVTTAGITLTLLGDYDWVFNITNMLSLGAGTNIVLAPGNEGSVTWNVGSYVSIGADAETVGTIFANGYITTGMDAKVSGAVSPSVSYEPKQSYCGGLFSASSYVTIGAGGTVGCSEEAVTSESDTHPHETGSESEDEDEDYGFE